MSLICRVILTPKDKGSSYDLLPNINMSIVMSPSNLVYQITLIEMGASYHSDALHLGMSVLLQTIQVVRKSL